MSPPQFVRVMISTGFPRVSGDEPSSGRGFTADVMFSPRERG